MKMATVGGFHKHKRQRNVTEDDRDSNRPKKFNQKPLDIAQDGGKPKKKRKVPLSRYDEHVNEANTGGFKRRRSDHNSDKDSSKKPKRRKEEKTPQQIAREKKLALKYKKVKFVERTKIERQLRKVCKKLEDDGDNREILDEKTKLLNDLRYIKFFPRNEKYISLFAENLTDKVKAKQEELRTEALHIASRTARGRNKSLLAFLSAKRNDKSGEDDEEEEQEQEQEKEREEPNQDKEKEVVEDDSDDNGDEEKEKSNASPKPDEEDDFFLS